MKAKFVNEAFEEKSKEQKKEDMLYPELATGNKKLEPHENYQLYKKIIVIFPHIKEIFENTYQIYPNYQIEKISKGDNAITFWLNKSGSCSIYYNNKKKLELLEKYKVSFQVPGNQEYGFSISINTTSEPRTVVGHELSPRDKYNKTVK